MSQKHEIESPTPRHPASQYPIGKQEQDFSTAGHKRTTTSSFDASAFPLMTSRLGNQQPPIAPPGGLYKKQKVEESPMDQLLAKLCEQQAKGLVTGSSSGTDSSNSPNSDPYVVDTPHSAGSASGGPENEVQRLQRELNAARIQMGQMQEELSLSRISKQTMNHVLGRSQTPSEFDFRTPDVTDQTLMSLQTAFNASTRPNMPLRNNGWTLPSGATEPLPPSALWPRVNEPSADPSSGPSFGNSVWNNVGLPGWQNGNGAHLFLPPQLPPQLPAQVPSRLSPQLPPDHSRMPLPPHSGRRPLHLDTQFAGPGASGYGNMMSSYGRRIADPPTRPTSAYGPRPDSWNQYSPATSVDGAMSFSPPATPHPYQGGNMYTHHHSQPTSARLSPTAAEYSADAPWMNQQVNKVAIQLSNLAVRANARKAAAASSDVPQYVIPVEPINYRKLLERNMNCNWKYIVDKIVCNNDQQASIFLQQKLKVGTPEQKYEIVASIIDQAYPLMINRFGNFLVQRCFEHGTPEQIVAIANAIRGNTLALSMDAFGCHVVQKAFDVVPEEYKASMVHELLRRIPETVIHRYACHVWQKLFELRWTSDPPQIMKYVNEALRGMWHEVALGETGSLVVQNIFENCLEDDKRPCINEVLASIDLIAHGQFGNWCIQHICEHGAPADRTRAIDHVLKFATEYSMDQFASKVVEKCLKISGLDFLDRYLDRVCEARPDRPRMALIDIAGDQFGNYLIQYILTHAAPHHREMVSSHIRKHMVSLRGSKYGSRVAMLCTNTSAVTRPGPPLGLPLTRYNTGSSSGRSSSTFGPGFR